MLKNEINIFLKREYHDKGKTQEQLAKELNVNQQTIQRLLSSEKKISGMSIDTFDKMFPNALINISGDYTIQQATNIQNITSQKAEKIQNIASNHSSVRNRIISAIMDSSLSPECKVEVYKIINAMEE